MPRSEEGHPQPTTPEDDELIRAATFARRTHKAMGIAIAQLERAARRRKTARQGKDPADPRT